MKKPNIKTAFNETMRKNSEIISGYCAKDIPSEKAKEIFRRKPYQTKKKYEK